MPKLRRPDGRVVSVSKTGVEALRARGYTDADEAPNGGTPEGGGDYSAPDPSALKSAWEEYARTRGVDPEGLTKAEIIERLG